MDENNLILGMQALMESFLNDNPNTSFEELDDIITVALDEVAETFYATVEADNDD